jgi:hypothetical protein
VAEYTVNATGVDDIEAAIKFAGARNLYLVVKNTGHDQYEINLPMNRTLLIIIVWDVPQEQDL